MSPLAEKLNNAITESNPHVLEMLSDYGKRIFFPSAGILAQSAEAKADAHLYNATIGIATEGGKPMGLDAITEQVNGLENAEYLPYAPSPGVPALRSKWQELQLEKNPTMAGKAASLPVVTNALTHGISLVGSLFMNPGETLVLSDHFWGNYNLYFNVTLGVDMKFFQLFNDEGSFNSVSYKETLLAAAEGKDQITTILNFPNNPTGYSVLKSDVEGILDAIKTVADTGTNVVVICDDAYFGLFFEEEVLKESLFGYFADLHERVLAVKVDGATKEDYVWGLRCGFLTYASKGLTTDGLKSLEQKTGGAIRATVSNISHLGQRMVLNSLSNADYAKQKAEKFEIMNGRYQAVKTILTDSRFDEYFAPYPYNSGYFMTMALKHGLDANEYRQYLLKNKGIGTISIGANNVRVAFSCTEEAHLADLFDKMLEAAAEMVSAK
jgi:aspartate/methionine/tyrosine aminotransferase